MVRPTISLLITEENIPTFYQFWLAEIQAECPIVT